MEENFFDKLRNTFREKSFHCYGYQYIFDNRIKKYNNLIGALKAMGIIVPSLIGALAISYGLQNKFLIWLMPIAVLATVIQFMISVFAIIYKWDDRLSYAYEASLSYNNLYRRFLFIADFPTTQDFNKLKSKYDSLETEHNARNQQDTKHNIKEVELRKGMRYSLRQFKRECVGCKTVPTSMKSTDCPICGNF